MLLRASEVEIWNGVFEGGTDFGAVGSEHLEGGLVPHHLPGGMSVQEMVMSGTKEHTIRDAGLTTVLPMFHVMGFTPSGRDFTPRPSAPPIPGRDRPTHPPGIRPLFGAEVQGSRVGAEDHAADLAVAQERFDLGGFECADE